MKQKSHYIAPECEVITVRLQRMINASGDPTTDGAETRNADEASQDNLIYDGPDDMPGGGSNSPGWFDPEMIPHREFDPDENEDE